MADPIYLSQQKYEYHVVPDVHRQMTTEVYSIDDVLTSDPKTNTTRQFSPFYSLRHAYGEQMEKSFWYGTRQDSQRDDDEGTEMYLSLVDIDFNPRVPAVEVLNVRTTCTNRDLPAKLPFGGRKAISRSRAADCFSKAKCLTKPTETILAGAPPFAAMAFDLAPEPELSVDRRESGRYARGAAGDPAPVQLRRYFGGAQTDSRDYGNRNPKGRSANRRPYRSRIRARTRNDADV
ncbi:MAG: type VI secretion system baseplate subunit TssF [Acidobacteria bacterium]|nr:type VI secretion system baseplate subunit TssF [Acidobacteriota bacterium]